MHYYRHNKKIAFHVEHIKNSNNRSLACCSNSVNNATKGHDCYSVCHCRAI